MDQHLEDSFNRVQLQISDMDHGARAADTGAEQLEWCTEITDMGKKVGSIPFKFGVNDRFK